MFGQPSLRTFLAPQARMNESATAGAVALRLREGGLPLQWCPGWKCLQTLKGEACCLRQQTHFCRRRLGCLKQGKGVFLQRHRGLHLLGCCNKICPNLGGWNSARGREVQGQGAGRSGVPARACFRSSCCPHTGEGSTEQALLCPFTKTLIPS